MPDWLTWLIGIAVTISLGLLGWQATRRQAWMVRVSSLEARLDARDARDLVWQDYTLLLRQHISDGSPPPPPPYPPELLK